MTTTHGRKLWIIGHQIYSFCIVAWLPRTAIGRVRFVAGFAIYLVASPIMNTIFTFYALLHCDEFSWGKTRAIVDEAEGTKA